jgi:replicative DNA helicase
MAEDSSPVFDRVPPHNLEAEESVLGSMIINHPAVGIAQELLTPEDFYKESHRRIYKVLCDLYASGGSTDPVVLVEELRSKGILESVGDREYIHELYATVPNPHNIKHYAGIVRDMAIRRRMIDCGYRIASLGYGTGDGVETVYDSAEESLFEIGQSLHRSGMSHVREPLVDSFNRMTEARVRGSRITGVPTGFYELDAMTSGLQPSNLIVIGGSTSMGKTSFALNVAHHAAVRERKGVLVFSLEMNKTEIAERLLLSEARVDSWKYRNGTIDEQEFSTIVEAAGVLSNAPIYIDDTGDMSVMQIRTVARQLMSREEISLIIVDYIQLMYSDNSENRAHEISRIARDLKITAMDLRVPVIAVSQLRRPAPTAMSKKPKLEDLKESGGIEQNADLAILIYRPERDNPKDDNLKGIAEINLAKHRNGRTGEFRLYWMSSFSKFENPAEEDVLVE